MHLVILLLAALALFVFLMLGYYFGLLPNRHL